MAENKIPMISELDMGKIYREIILKMGEDEVSSFVVFDDQPFDMAHFILPNGNSLIYLNKCKNLSNKIIKEMSKGTPTDEAPEFAVHSLDNNEVSMIYTMGILISEMLNIPCPQIEFRDNMDEWGTSIGEKNFVTLRAVSGDCFLVMLHSLAHEIRHLWQYKNHPEYYEEKASYKDSLDRYYNSLSEIDAEAFANKLEYEIFGDSQIDTDEYLEGNEEVRIKVAKQMESIEIDEEKLYTLKGLLGYL